MEKDNTCGGKGLPSPKEILKRHLTKLLNTYLRWEELLKESERFFMSDLGAKSEPVDRKKKRPKLDGDHLNNSGDSVCDESKAIACLDWRTNNGALTQDEKTRLHRDLRIVMKNVSGTDLMLTEFIARYKMNDDVIT